MELDDVHGAHREACAIDQATDVAVEVDVGEAGRLGSDLGGILFRGIMHRLQVLVPEERVVVETELRVDRHDPAVRSAFARRRDDQGVDLDQIGIGVGVELCQLLHDRGGLPDLPADETEPLRHGSCFVGFEPVEGMDRGLEDRIGILVRHGLDLDAALGARDDRVQAATSIQGDRKVELLGDVDACGDEQSLHLDAFGPGLHGHHAVPKHEGRGFAGFLDALDQFHESSLATAAGVDLGLDHDQGLTGLQDGTGFGHRVVDGLDHAAGGDRDAGVGEELSGLVLVDLHRI